MTENVGIIVRCAIQTGADIPVDCPTDWTVKQLKEHLYAVCTLKPAVATQRLIYGGKCLKDEQTMEEVLARSQHFDHQPVFHLVCPMNQQAAPEVRQRSTANPTPSTPSSPPTSQPAAPQQAYGFTQPTNPQEYMQAWQAYQQMCFNNYMQYMSSAYGMANPAMVATPQFTQQMPTFANVNPQPEMMMPQNDAAAPAQPLMVDEEGHGVDLLDLMYRTFRIGLFVMVVWLYSSIERFLVVFCMGLFIYFMKLRRDRLAAAAAASPPPPPSNVTNNNAGEPTADEGPEPVPIPVDQPTTGQIVLSTAYSFITAFFTSIVPDNPVPANLN
ncbi:unnamed protein product, partial [Mesorhabditis spiculigera]